MHIVAAAIRTPAYAVATPASTPICWPLLLLLLLRCVRDSPEVNLENMSSASRGFVPGTM
jgi:hypothetical protein